MKKTVIALSLIASFGAAAADKGQPTMPEGQLTKEQQAQVLNHYLDKTGFNTDDNNTVYEVSIDADGTFVLIDNNGEKWKGDSMVAKFQAMNANDKNQNQWERPQTGVEVVNNLFERAGTDAKLHEKNANGKYVITTPEGSVEVTEEIATVISNAAKVGIDARRELAGKNPVIDPIEVPVEEKIAEFNKRAEAAGYSANIYSNANGDTILGYEDPRTGEKHTIDLGSLSPAEIDVAKVKAKQILRETAPGVDPIDVIIEPIDPGFGVDPISYQEEKRQILNENLEGKTHEMANVAGKEIAMKDMSVAEDGTFNATIVHEDEHGNLIERTVSYQMDGSNNDKIRAAVKEYASEAPIVDPIPGEPVEPTPTERVVDGLKQAREVIAETYTGDLARDAIADTDARINEVYSRTAANSQAIEKNSEDILFLKNEVNRLDDKMDSVMAGVHAVNNARPYLTTAGQTAVGAGVGFAGSEQAVAVGVAHAFTTNLSASMTLNATTGSNSEVSGGAGVQYSF